MDVKPCADASPAQALLQKRAKVTHKIRGQACGHLARFAAKTLISLAIFPLLKKRRSALLHRHFQRSIHTIPIRAMHSSSTGLSLPRRLQPAGEPY
jgi:hypothetical protein